MTNNTLWVHGNAAHFQDTTGVTKIEYTGPGLIGTFAIDAKGWVHIPLPTPVELDDEQVEIVAVHVQMGLGVVDVGEVAIYDGPNRILKTSGYSDVYGFSPAKPIQYGVGISFQLSWEHGADDQKAQAQEIIINAAGIEYTTPTVYTEGPNTPTKPVQGQPTN
jgi:hypothetical protein